MERSENNANSFAEKVDVDERKQEGGVAVEHSSEDVSVNDDDAASGEDDHICVCEDESDDSKALELPLADDKTLPCSTLAHSFPKAVGLKYLNPSTRLYRTLAVDDENKCVLPPKGGWAGRRFVAIFDEAPTERKRLSGSEDIGDTVGCPDEGQTDRLLMPVDLFVRNLSFKTTDETLKNFFEKYGEVQYAEVKKDYRTGLPRGYGFIKMKNIEDQEKVLKEGDFYIDDRLAQVKYPDHGQNCDADRISTKLYVGRVYDDITENDLQDLFETEARKISELAKVERVFLPKPCRGFAYVSLNDPNVVKRLCQIRDFICAGKSIYVSVPRPKSKEKETPTRASRDRLSSYRMHPYGNSNPPLWLDDFPSRGRNSIGGSYHSSDPYRSPAFPSSSGGYSGHSKSTWR